MNWTFSESFAGIGAWGKAMKKYCEWSGDSCELKWFSEIEKFPELFFKAIHETKAENIGDITKDIDVPEVDIFFYSPPCQTFSIAGKREGTNVEKGNLFYNALDKLKKANPKYAIMENVKGLVTGNTKDDFIDMVAALSQAGYFSYWKILNAKNYGIPHKRQRLFIVSIRKDLHDKGKKFEFPVPYKSKKGLFDVLQSEVEPKYLLSQDMIDSLATKNNNFNGEFKIKHFGELANCIDTKEGQRRTNNFIACVYQKPRGYNKGGFKTICPTISSNSWQENNILFENKSIGKYNGFLVRKFTPLECFRFQGFDDEDYYKCIKAYDREYGTNKDGSTRSDSQLYKAIGNSIYVGMIVEMLKNLLGDRKQAGNQLSMF